MGKLLLLTGALICSPAVWAETVLTLPSNATPVLTTFGNPATYVKSPPSVFESVGRIIFTTPGGSFGCSGALLTGGLHVLTAAHCMSDNLGRPASSMSATFITTAGTENVAARPWAPHPDWTGDLGDGADIGLVTLSRAVDLPGFGLSAYLAAPGDVVLAGYGRSGTGTTGDTLGFGTLRAGLNNFDAVFSANDPAAPAPYFALDFDDGTQAHNTIGIEFGWPEVGLGTGANEVMVAPGDSGGPALFWNTATGQYEIGGVHSFRAQLRDTAGNVFGDISPGLLNSSFGEVAGDTRVALYADWVEAMMAVPEPSTILLMTAGLLALVVTARRKQDCQLPATRACAQRR